MPDKKLTDAEIVKALECCDGSFDKCGECPLDNVNQDKLRCWELEKSALDLINRQKAEIKDLQKVVVEDYASEYDNKIKAEAYKEFAERLKDKHRKIIDYDEAGFGAQIFIVEEKVIDNLLKEMAGDNNGQ